MYYLLKQTTFFLKIENDKLFLKNNFGNLKINTQNSYQLFKRLAQYLDGKNDIEKIIQIISNENLKKFYIKLLDMLKERKFLLYSNKEIDISIYNNFAKGLMIYCDDLEKLRPLDFTPNLVIRSSSTKINNVFYNIMKENFFITEVVNDESNIITINIDCEYKENIYIYKQKDESNIIISTKTPNSIYLDSKLLDLPIHIYKVMASILEIEIGIKIYNIGYDKFFENDFVFDLRLLSFKHRP